MKKIFLFLILFSLNVSSQVTLETIYETPNSKINLYIVSQGYTSSTIGEFNTFVNGFLNSLWATAPYGEFQQNFRIILVRDIATTNTYPRAFNQFSTPYLCSSDPTAADGAETYVTYNSRMDQLISTYIPDYNDNSYLMAIFNNNFYTGGGGKYTFVTDYSCNNSPAYMYNVLIHEFGHSFGLLGDEYGPQAGQSVGPTDFPLFHNRNITNETSFDNIPWNYLISPSTPIPTCTYNNTCSSTVTGLYESANYSNTGWYRPQNECKMLHVMQPFCLTCQNIIRETIIKHLCNSNVSISENFESRHQKIAHWRKSTDNLTSNSVVGNKINLNYLAGNSITLTNGFHSKEGSNFRAYTGDCSYIDVRTQYRTLSKESNDFPLLEELKDLNIYKDNLSITPNPSADLVNISYENGMINKFILTTIDGKVVFNSNSIHNSSFQLDLSLFSKGIYILKIDTSDNKIFIEKIIKK